MLKAAIVLWLLASIYGLEIVDVVKKDVKVPPETLKEIQKDVKEKVNYLLLHSVIDWKDTHVIFSIMHHNASLVFQKKLTRELDDVRLSVQTAHDNGIDAIYSIQDIENILQAFQKSAELKFKECEAAGWKDFINNYDIITKVIEAGYRALKEIENIHNKCWPINEGYGDGVK
ncbi:hypothetical protein KM043_017524 [Ampulex compressa]|nr:hypothetical protein KM043_017524 [Ampulex compressa]